MKAVLYSINKPHTNNIKLKLKTVELRTRPPKINEPYKAYIYETKKNGGCGKVIGEFTAYNENTYRVCMGVPAHLVYESCVSTYNILKYSNNGKKDVTAISISDLVIYDKPKELSEFYKPCIDKYKYCQGCKYGHNVYPAWIETAEDLEGICFDTFCLNKVERPPQSWCYVEELTE